jgi:hypothetical protein
MSLQVSLGTRLTNAISYFQSGPGNLTEFIFCFLTHVMIDSILLQQGLPDRQKAAN